MALRQLDLQNILARFEADADTRTYRFCQQAFEFATSGESTEAISHSRMAMHDALIRGDRCDQALASGYAAAIYASLRNFDEAIRQAEDCYRIYNQNRKVHNAIIGRLLLAAIYRLHLDYLNHEIADVLDEGRAQAAGQRDSAKGKGDLALADQYEEQYLEMGDQERRLRWIPAIPHTLPLIWVPVLEQMTDPEARGVEPIGYMEPVLFVLKNRQDAEDEEAGRSDPGEIEDVLYSAHALPSIDGSEPASPRPPRLRTDVVYAAVRVGDAASSTPGLRPDDYLLVRRLGSRERAELTKQAGSLVGYYFRRHADNRIEVIQAVPPKFVGEEEIRMFVAKVDAILRRVP